MRRSKRALPLILLTCLGLRLAFFIAVRPWDPEIADRVVLFKDGRDYNRVAINFVFYRQFAVERDGPLDAYRTPLFPLLAGGLYAMVGIRPWVVLLAEAFLDTATCLVLYVALRRHLNDRVASISASFYALDPVLILYCCHFLTDIVFVFASVLAASLLASALAGESRRFPYAVASGAVFGLAALARPIALYMPVVIAVPTAILLRRRPAAAVKLLGAFSAAFFVALLPWMIRNYRAFGSFSISTSGPFNILALNVAPAEAARTGEDLPEARRRLFKEADQLMQAEGIDPDHAGPFTQARYWQKVGIGYIMREPVIFVKAYAGGIAYMFTNLASGIYTNMLEHHPGLPKSRRSPTQVALILIIGPYLLVTYACTLAGLFLAWRDRRSALLLVFVAIAVYFVLATGAGGMARFKIPAIPFYLAFAGIGGWRALEWAAVRAAGTRAGQRH